MQLKLPIDQTRGGIFLPTIDTHSPCYFPQYDTIWCPIDFMKDFNNEPSFKADDFEGKLKFLISYEHEMGHRHINYRTVLGYVHLTFTMLKIHDIFYWLPTLGDWQRINQRLPLLDKKSRTFFQSSQILDETFALMHTIDYARAYKMNDIIERYKGFSFQHYPSIKKPFEQLDFILHNLKEPLENRILLIKSIFDTAAAVELLEVFSIDPNEEMPLALRVDDRFKLILNFCTRSIENKPAISLQELAAKLFIHLEEHNVPIGVQYDMDEYEELFDDVIDYYLDGLFSINLYRVLTGQLLKDTQKLLKSPQEINYEYPLSLVTLRNFNEGNEIMPVLREKLIGESTGIHMTNLKINTGLAAWDFFKMGTIADSIIQEKWNPGRKMKAFKIFGKPESRMLDIVRQSLEGKRDPENIREEFSNYLDCISGS